jgi:hypothetical protein
MLLRQRRIFALLAFCLLAEPPVVGLVAPDSPASVFREGRSLAPAPRLPTTVANWLALPGRPTPTLKTTSGLREKMIRLHIDLSKPLFTDGDGIWWMPVERYFVCRPGQYPHGLSGDEVGR